MSDLDKLISWLKTKPADKGYHYLSNCGCLLAQFYSEQGYKDVQMYSYQFHFINESGVPDRKHLPKHFNSIALDDVYFRFQNKELRVQDRTFGGALKRAMMIKHSQGARS